MCESDCILLLDVLVKMQISCHSSINYMILSFTMLPSFSLMLQINMQEGWPLLHI